jgi:hypothetical protein
MSWKSFFIETINPPKGQRSKGSLNLFEGKAFAPNQSFEIATIDYERYKMNEIIKRPSEKRKKKAFIDKYEINPMKRGV